MYRSKSEIKRLALTSPLTMTDYIFNLQKKVITLETALGLLENSASRIYNTLSHVNKDTDNQEDFKSLARALDKAVPLLDEYNKRRGKEIEFDDSFYTGPV